MSRHNRPFVDPPIHVNEIGNKFWLDESSTDYARKDMHMLNGDTQEGLKGWTVFYVELVAERNKRIMILVNDKQEVVYETQQLDAMAIQIDVLKFLKHDLKTEKSIERRKKPSSWR